MAALVVRAAEVVHTRSGLPRHDSCVWVLDCRHTSILVDFQKAGPFDTFLRVITEIPESDRVWDFQCFQCDGNLDGIRPGGVRVQNDWLETRRHGHDWRIETIRRVPRLIVHVIWSRITFQEEEINVLLLYRIRLCRICGGIFRDVTFAMRDKDAE